jgi:hypothetical protein
MATEGGLEEAGKLGVSVGDVLRFALTQFGNNSAQRQKAPIDI